MYISSNTETVIENEIEQAVISLSRHYKVDEALTRAIIRQETNSCFSAIRFEEHLKSANWYLRLLDDDEKKDDFCFCSFGIMQILYGMAKHHGFKGKPFDLMCPYNSVAYGLEYYTYLARKLYYFDKAISAYNQGESLRQYTRGKNKGKFLNYQYVENVMKYYLEYGGNPEYVYPEIREWYATNK